MIAASAGISPARFDRHFADKHQFLDEAYELQASTFTVGVREAFSGAAPRRDRLVLRIWSEDVTMASFMMIGALVGARSRRDAGSDVRPGRRQCRRRSPGAG